MSEVTVEGITLRIPEPFLQRHLEAFQAALWRLTGDDDNLTVAVYRGAVLRAACECGWVEGVAVDGVGDLRPGVVAYLSDIIHRRVTEAQAPPKGR